MFGRILIGVGLVCLLLGDPTESYAQAHRSPAHRSHSRGHHGGDLLGSVLETIVDEAIDHLTNTEEPFDGPELVPADLSSLDGYGVPR